MIQSFFLNNVENARELGGYITADGKSIRHGVLLRTAKLADASDEDISKLRNEFNLGYVTDFRMDQENGCSHIIKEIRHGFFKMPEIPNGNI